MKTNTTNQHASTPDLQPIPRLLVLVPESEIDIALAAQKICGLARSFEGGAQFIGLCKDAAHESSLRCQLALLSAMVGNEYIPVKSKIEIGSNWLNAVKLEWQHGDVIAYFSEKSSALPQRPLSQILESNLNATVYVLNGLHHQGERSKPNWVSAALPWGGSIGLILGFFWLQSKIIQPPQDLAHSILLYISILAEAGSIWVWNSLFG
jgi:hypothetical protein